MPRRDDDIFRKLKYEKPLVKSALDSEYKMPDKSTFDMILEQKHGKKAPSLQSSIRKPLKRGTMPKSSQPKPKELDIFTAQSKSSTRAKDAVHDIDYGSKETRESQVKAAAPVQKQEAPKRQEQGRHESPVLPSFIEEKTAATVRTAPQAETRQKQSAAGEAMYEMPVRQKPQPLPQQRKSTNKGTAVIKTSNAGSVEEKMFRHEQKYYINYKDHIVLRTALRAVMRPDENANEAGGYQIRSLYFDDIYETALAEKIAGTDDRCKYRIRIYNYSDGNIKLEKKQKFGKFIKKTSISLTREECDSLIAGEGRFLLEKENNFAKEFYIMMKTRLMRPKVIVDYWREAYVYPIEDVRVTFDIDLKGSTMLTDIFDPDTPVFPVLDNGIMVLEVKFNKYLPECVKCALGSVGAVKRSAISKYVLCRKFD